MHIQSNLKYVSPVNTCLMVKNGCIWTFMFNEKAYCFSNTKWPQDYRFRIYACQSENELVLCPERKWLILKVVSNTERQWSKLFVLHTLDSFSRDSRDKVVIA